jgi:hypothetical protein
MNELRAAGFLKVALVALVFFERSGDQRDLRRLLPSCPARRFPDLTRRRSRPSIFR